MDSLWEEHWGKAREKGRTYYVIWRGGTLGGLMFFTLSFLPRYFGLVEPDYHILYSATAFCALGFLIGGVLWSINERSYQRKQDRGATDD